jgi:NADPH:quinone reductase-like Zn-dependent oxidoreductase
VLIKVTAAAINPVDWKIRDWGIFVDEYPAIVGSDAAGVIVQTGSNVKNVKEGDRVTFQGIINIPDSSTFQQYVTLPAELVGVLPDSVSDEEGAGICLASMAVIASFYHEDGVDIKPRPWEKGGNKAGEGKSIVIVGGSSSVGQYAIQLARLSGFSNIVTASSAKHHDHLKKLGAHAVLDRKNATPEDYAKACKGYPLGTALNSISTAETGVLAVEILAAANPNGAPSNAGVGQSTVIHLLDVTPEMKEAAQKAGNANIRLTNVWGIGSAPHLRSTSTAFMKALSGPEGYLAKGQMIPNKPLVVKGGLAALDEALEKNKTGVSGEKVVILPNEE